MFGQERALMVLDVCAKFGVQQKSGSPDTGPFVTPKRPQKGSFDCFLKTVHQILLIFCQNGALIVLDVCIKFGGQKNLVLEMWGKKGSNGGQNGPFR